MLDKIKNIFNDKLHTSDKDVKLLRFTPVEFKEAKQIVSELSLGNVVIVDLSEISREESIRLIDFVSGALSVTGGKYKKVAVKTYLLSPSLELLNSFDEELAFDKYANE